MKKNVLIIALFVFANTSFGQAWMKNLPKTKTSKELTLFDYQKAFNDYWKPFNVKKGYYIENGVKKKAAGWKQFKRWEWNMEGQINPQTGAFPTKTAQQIYDEFKKANPSLKGFKAASWTSSGPSSSDGGYAGVGRINCIAFHPSDNNTYWVGAPAGGLWKTTDNGVNWTSLTDGNAVLGISDIVIPSDYATSNTIYIATGDRDGWDNNSVGVLKSTDGGVSWNATGLSFNLSDGEMVARLLLNPSDDNNIIAATSAGVYETTNGGTSWTQIITGYFIDMEYKPGDFSILYGATKYGKVYVYDGTTLTNSLDLASGYRIELAVTPANSSVVYAVVAGNDGSLEGIYKSINSGADFDYDNDSDEDPIYSASNLFGWYSDGSDNGGQGSYDNSIAVSPTDADLVLVGGVNSHKSTDGGVNWSASNCWTSYSVYNLGSHPVVHADKHKLIYRSNGDLFECNDGGVYISTDDGGTWTDKTNGMVISQMYKLGVSQTVSNEVIAGLQDNGTKLLSGGTWTDVKGGDGMECLIDYTDVNIQYGTYTNGDMARTINHWGSATDVTQDANGPINGLDETGAWVTPYIIDPNNNQTLYIGMNNVWKTINQGDSWTKISTMNSSNKIRAMAIAESNTSVLYVTDHSSIWKTTTGGSPWTDITGTLPVGTSDIREIAIKATDENTVWVALSGYNGDNVYESTDGGANWTNISAGLPQLPAYSIVQNTQSTDEVQLYLGTELGVYFKKGSADWVAYNTGLPNVKIGEIEIYYDANPANNKLRAATYGRGLWETGVEPGVANLAAVITDDVTDIAETSVTLNGNIASEGQSGVTERGFVWGASANPTTSDTKIVDASTGVGTYSSSLTGLTRGDTYHVRAYAINSYGASYGADKAFTPDWATSVKELKELKEQGISIFPNPSDGNFVIEANKEFNSIKISVRDMMGKIVLDKIYTEKRNEIDLSKERAGIYFIQIEIEGEISTSKIVIE